MRWLMVLLGAGLVADPAAAVDVRGSAWTALSPRPGVRFVDVAARPDNPLQVAALAADGSLYVSRDGGRTWDLALATDGREVGTSTEEEGILDLEVRFQEVLQDSVLEDGLDPDATDQDPQAVEDTVSDALESASAEVFGDLEADPDFVIGDLPSGPVMDGRVVWTTEAIFVGLNDRLMVSKTEGRRWDTVLDVRTWDVVPLADRAVALTEDGARVAFELRSWFDLEDGTEGLSMVGGIRADGILAASERGLWYSAQGETWTRWGSLDQPVLALSVEPDRAERVWVATGEGIRISEDGGKTFGDPVYSGEVDDVVCLGGGAAMALVDGGAVYTDDGGASFVPVRRGLASISAGRLAVRSDGAVLVAGREGVFALRPLSGLEDKAPPWVPLDALVEGSVSRQGVGREFDAFRRRWSAALMPQLVVEAYVAGGESKDWSASLGTQRDEDRDWRVLARLLWVPRGSRTSSLRGDLTGFDVDPGVLTVRGEPLLIAGEDDYVVAARLDRATLEYTAELVNQISTLYRSRLELVAERRQTQADPLFRRVLHELAIAELEARLDALTGGAVQRWRSDATTQEL